MGSRYAGLVRAIVLTFDVCFVFCEGELADTSSARELMKCNKPPPIVENAHLVWREKPGGYDDGEYIKYGCNEGYARRIFTSSFLQCRQGTWARMSSWAGIKCIAIACPPLYQDPYGNYEVIEGKDFRYKSKYRISCKAGYRFGGRDSNEALHAICGRNKEWSVKQPKCEAITCPPLYQDPYGNYEAIEGKDFRYKSKYMISCKAGYRFGGTGSYEALHTICGLNGEWSVKQSKCGALTCPPLYQDPYGSYKAIEGNDFQYKSKYRISCNAGYRLGDPYSGEAVDTICGRNGEWSVQQSKCEENNGTPSMEHLTSDTTPPVKTTLIIILLPLAGCFVSIVMAVVVLLVIKRRFSRKEQADDQNENQIGVFAYMNLSKGFGRQTNVHTCSINSPNPGNGRKYHDNLDQKKRQNSIACSDPTGIWDKTKIRHRFYSLNNFLSIRNYHYQKRTSCP